MLTAYRIGKYGKGHSQHSGPCSTDQEVADEKQPLVMEKQSGNKSDAPNYKTYTISHAPVLEIRQYAAHTTEPMACTANSMPFQLAAS